MLATMEIAQAEYDRMCDTDDLVESRCQWCKQAFVHSVDSNQIWPKCGHGHPICEVCMDGHKGLCVDCEEYEANG